MSRWGPVALVVSPDGQSRTERLPGGDVAALKRVQELTGGYIEAIGGLGSWCAYLAEEGKLMRMPRNVGADTLARRLGWSPFPDDFLVGTVVFLGRSGPDETDVPDSVLSAARELGVLSAARSS